MDPARLGDPLQPWTSACQFGTWDSGQVTSGDPADTWRPSPPRSMSRGRDADPERTAPRISPSPRGRMTPNVQRALFLRSTPGLFDDRGSETGLAVRHSAITLTTDGPACVRRGLATLRQAVTNTTDGFAIPLILIEDAPRFVWRGATIHVARHFYSSTPAFFRRRRKLPA
jgi:hypothetical protein